MSEEFNLPDDSPEILEALGQIASVEETSAPTEFSKLPDGNYVLVVHSAKPSTAPWGAFQLSIRTNPLRDEEDMGSLDKTVSQSRSQST